MDREQIKKSQKKILKRIYNVEPCKSREATGILKTIKSYTGEDANYAMGVFGKRLRGFARSIDLSHPDLSNIFDGQLVGKREGSFSKDATDLLKLAAHGRAWDLSVNVLENLKRVITCHECYKSLKTNIGNPTDNLQHVRFLSDSLVRSSCRCQKTSLNVPLDILYKKSEEFWNQNPDNFDWVMRGRMMYADDIKLAEAKKKHFEDHGLKSMSQVIEASIKNMQGCSMTNSYCKFNKISLTTVAVVLGKMMGYRYEVTRAYAPDGVFEGHQFERQPDFCDEAMSYTPRVYNIDDLDKPDEMKALIDFLEEYPDMAGKPLFDHYRVFVPAVSYPSSDPFYSQTTPTQHQKSIDSTLMSKGLMLAVLLGERDGEHYFVSYWM